MGRRFLMWGVGPAGAVTVSLGVAIAPGDTPRSRAAEAPIECSGSAAVDFECHERRYTQLGRRDGPGVALRALAADQKRNGYVRAACHQLTHRIGRAAGSLRGIDALGAGRPVCASGYYHGVLQAVMSKMGARGAIENAAAICAEVRGDDRSSAEHYNCVHGMGHGFMEVFASDLFESLDGCGELDDSWEKDECTGGVFMENVTAVDNQTRPSRYLRPKQPLYPCTEVAEHLWDQCYDWQITYALYVNDSDFAKVFALCAGRSRGERAPCYRGVGGDVLQQSKFVTTARPGERRCDGSARWGPTARHGPTASRGP